jgi:hypothetical protein
MHRTLNFRIRSAEVFCYFPRRFSSCIWWKSGYCLCVTESRPKPYVCDNLDRTDDIHRRVQKWMKDKEIQDPYYHINPIALEFSKENISLLMKELKVPFCVLLKMTSTSKGGKFGGSGGCLRIEKSTTLSLPTTDSAGLRRHETLRHVVHFLTNDVRLYGLDLARILYIHPSVVEYRSKAHHLPLASIRPPPSSNCGCTNQQLQTSPR